MASPTGNPSLQPNPETSRLNETLEQGKARIEQLPKPPEIEPRPDQTLERPTADEPSSEQPQIRPSTLTPTLEPPTALAPAPKSDLRREIDAVMTEDLEDVFTLLDEQQRIVFKQKGEETASAIEQLITTAKLTVKKLLHLIRDWLKTIPKVNAFFLEQMTKIKTDRMIEISDKQGKQHLDHL